MKRCHLLMSSILILALFSGCKAEKDRTAELHTTTFFAMDTIMELSVYGNEKVLSAAEKRVAALEKLFSVTDPDSEIYALNHNGASELSGDTAACLADGLDLCRRTGGALDLSVYPVERAWGFTTGNYRIPSEQELSALLPLVDYSRIPFDKAVISLDQGMEIDLGGIAKGYTGDQLLQLFRENGVSSALINLGGNIQAVGAKPDGTPWRIGIQDPFGDGYLGTLDAVNQAVITSGGYERYFEENGQVYWHIIDPSTGYPAKSGLLSVTVVGEQGVLCDGLSTALSI